MRNQARLMTPFSAAIAALLVAVPTGVSAQYHDEEVPFDQADVYAELNDTDGDLGIHALIDGGPWKRLVLEGPNGRKLLDVKVRGRLRRQGLTEFFFESAEPPFDELSPGEFFKRFPAGEYEIEGRTLDGQELESEDLFSHVMPAQPGLQDDDTIQISVGGIVDEVQRERCDDEDPTYDPIVVVADRVTIDWDPVVSSHPWIGEEGDIEVAKYQVVVEELETESVLSVDLPPDVTEMSLPENFLALGEEFKYEILVKEEEGGNQTAIESCFSYAP